MSSPMVIFAPGCNKSPSLLIFQPANSLPSGAVNSHSGNVYKKRCCKEGPVFDSRILFPETSDSVKAPARTPSTPGSGKADLSVTIAGVKFQNPVIGCSGTFGFGSEYASVIDVNKLGGICSKGLTLEPRQGNDGMRVWETPSGLMNSIGLQNPGIPHFIENELPYMMSLKPVAIANLSGSSL